MAAVFTLRPGMVFWAKNGDAAAKRPHPRIIVSKVVNGKVLTVNFTDPKNYPNGSCFFEKTECECLHKRSVVFYAAPLELDAAPLAKIWGSNHPQIDFYPDLSPALLARVLAGLIATGDILDKTKEDYGIIPRKSPNALPF